MKNLVMTALAGALSFATPAFAEEAHHPEIAAKTAKNAPSKAAAKESMMQMMVDRMPPPAAQ